MLQVRFKKTRGKRWKRLLYEERFRAGYDFLLLRAEEDKELKELAEFWTRAQEGMVLPSARPKSRSGRRDRPRRRYRRRSRQTG